MVVLRILKVLNGKRPGGVELHVVMGLAEFEQLVGSLDNLCVFPTKIIDEPSSIIKTGARHSHAKYLLVPSKLRRQFNLEDFDVEKITCGKVNYKESLFLVFKVPRKISGSHMRGKYFKRENQLD